MKLFSFIKKIFVEESNNPFKTCEKKIKRMGYKKSGEGTFIKESSNGRTMISLSSQGVKIKVYAFGYSESDFMPAPLDDMDRLKRFILSNQL